MKQMTSMVIIFLASLNILAYSHADNKELFSCAYTLYHNVGMTSEKSISVCKDISSNKEVVSCIMTAYSGIGLSSKNAVNFCKHEFINLNSKAMR